MTIALAELTKSTRVNSTYAAVIKKSQTRCNTIVLVE